MPERSVNRCIICDRQWSINKGIKSTPLQLLLQKEELHPSQNMQNMYRDHGRPLAGIALLDMFYFLEL